MQSYVEPLITADKILQAYLDGKGQRGDYGHIVNFMGLTRGSEETKWIEKAIDKLVKDGYFDADGHSNNYYNISGNGVLFIQHGGYKQKIENENLKETITDAIQQSGLKTDRNVRITNVSVRRLNKLLKPISIAQIIVSFATLGVAILAALVSWWAYKANKDSNAVEKRLLLLDTRLEKIEQSQQKLQQPQEKNTPQKKDSTKV